MRIALGALILVFALLATSAVLVTFADGTVSRSRVERFARRQRLPITAGNGNQVIRYLATTRRWRTMGFLAGILASQIGAPPETIIHFNFIVIFAGWFLGALVAEVRVAHLEYGSVRAASLLPRRPGRYVRRFAWALVPAAAVVALATGAATAAAGTVGWARPDWPAAGAWLAAALVLAAAVRAVQHAVLGRPQPLAPPDILAADDGMRSRSLHVLSGGGAAVVLFAVLNQLSAIHPGGLLPDQLIDLSRTAGVFAIALFGWSVATSIWPPPVVRAA
jgi:hypothetical protein